MADRTDIEGLAFRLYGFPAIDLGEWLELWPEHWIRRALAATQASCRHPHPNYTRAILQGWAREGGPPKETPAQEEQRERSRRDEARLWAAQRRADRMHAEAAQRALPPAEAAERMRRIKERLKGGWRGEEDHGGSGDAR